MVASINCWRLIWRLALRGSGTTVLDFVEGGHGGAPSLLDVWTPVLQKPDRKESLKNSNNKSPF